MKKLNEGSILCLIIKIYLYLHDYINKYFKIYFYI